MKIISSHKCAAMNPHQKLRYIVGIVGGFTRAEKRGGWFLAVDPNWSTAVKYCPYCGEELAQLDVKIKVSRKMLETWIDRLWNARGDSQLITGEIRAVLDADD